jgi:hypothetical protein
MMHSTPEGFGSGQVVDEKQARLDVIELNAAREVIADYFHEGGSEEEVLIAEFAGGTLRQDPQKAARFLFGLQTKVVGLQSAAKEPAPSWNSLDDTGLEQVHTLLDSVGVGLEGAVKEPEVGWMKVGESDQEQIRYLPFHHAVKKRELSPAEDAELSSDDFRRYDWSDHLLVERRTVRTDGKETKHSFSLVALDKQLEAKPAERVSFSASVREVADGYTGVVDYEGAWRDFSPIFEPGTTEYKASVPVIADMGNRPSLMFDKKDNLQSLDVDLSVSLSTYGEPIVIRLEADAAGELMGTPISKWHDFGQPEGQVSEPEFLALSVTLTPGKDPVLLGERLDGSMVRMTAAENIVIKGTEDGRVPDKIFSGIHGFISPILLRTRGKLRHTKLGIHTTHDGQRSWVEPSAGMDKVIKNYLNPNED